MILLTKSGKQIVNKMCGAIIELLNNFDIEFLMHLHPLDLFADFSVNDGGFSFFAVASCRERFYPSHLVEGDWIDNKNLLVAAVVHFQLVLQFSQHRAECQINQRCFYIQNQWFIRHRNNALRCQEHLGDGDNRGQ